LHAVVRGNGHGRCLNEGGEAERANGALFLFRVLSVRRRFGSTFPRAGRRRRRGFAVRGATGSRLRVTRLANRRIRDECEHLERQCRKDDQPGYRSSEHFRNYKLPNSGTATEIPARVSLNPRFTRNSWVPTRRPAGCPLGVNASTKHSFRSLRSCLDLAASGPWRGPYRARPELLPLQFPDADRRKEGPHSSSTQPRRVPWGCFPPASG